MTQPGLFQRHRTIESGHIDGLGHVNNVVWVEFVLELATAHARSVGLGYKATAALGGLWIVHRHEISYHQPAYTGEEILEETWISRIRGARSVRHSRFTRPDDGTLLLSAVTSWAYVDVKTHRPRRIDRVVLEAFPVLAR